MEEHQELTLKLDKIWREYEKQKKQGMAKKDLIKLFKQFYKTMNKWWHYGAIGEDKCEIINLEIAPKFQKRHNLSEQKAFEIINILTHPKEQAVFNLEKKDFLKICLQILKSRKAKADLFKGDFGSALNDKKVQKSVNIYIKNYFWFKTDFCKAIIITPEMLLKEVRQEIIKNKLSAIKIKKEINKIDNNFKKIQNQKIKILKNIKLTKEDRDDIIFSQKIIYWFDQRKLKMMKHIYYFFNILEYAAKQFNIDSHNASLHTADELFGLLTADKKLSKKECSKRNSKIFIVYEKNKKAEIFYENDAQEMLEMSAHAQSKTVKGVVASAGRKKKFTGIVRIVHNPAKDEFNNQDILVTSMTRIEFVPLMRKAKAIITDEGGIACHAAIVSRELGIPAIIGTKIATQVLKDGDLVEVDADKGVVKILEK
ncbi:hypothetical protein KKH38_02760 [Patescibacteria group bacterium]|nr:hypothetical protein [Patescibacteria group bacterium]MBU4600952.1 hypothetical protein [Patescibacteria group bacterium]